MKTWKEAIEKVQENINQGVVYEPGNSYVSPAYDGDITTFAQLCGIDYCGWNLEFSQRMVKVWIKSWICTDTRVGIAVYVFDNKIVATSFQSARKSDEQINFVSGDAYHEVKNAILDYLKDDLDEELPIIEVDDLDEFPMGIRLNTQITPATAKVNGISKLVDLIVNFKYNSFHRIKHQQEKYHVKSRRKNSPVYSCV